MDSAQHERRRKDQNRCAAQSYRKRQRDLGSSLEAQYEALRTRNTQLAAECHRLEQSVEGMRQVLATTAKQHVPARLTPAEASFVQPHMMGMPIPPTASTVSLQPQQLPKPTSFLNEIKQEPADPSPVPAQAELRLRTGSSDAGYFSDTYSEASLDSSKVLAGATTITLSDQRPVVVFQPPALPIVIPSPQPVPAVGKHSSDTNVHKSKLSRQMSDSGEDRLPADPRDRKKEQNRRASKRFRERKKEERCLEEQELHHLEATNAKLKLTHASLSTAIDTLRNRLLLGDSQRHGAVQIDLFSKK